MEASILKKMSGKEKKLIVAGIAEYKHEQEVIKRVLKRHKRLSGREFDRVFGDSKFIVTPMGEKLEVRRRPKFRFMGGKGETFILGDIFAVSNWSKWLSLIQIMRGLGIVHLEGEEKEIYYSLKEKDGD